MGQIDKFLAKLQKIPKDITFDELHNVLTGPKVDWSFRNHGSSHYTYFLDNDLITIPKHKVVKPIYIIKVVQLLKEQGIIKDE